MGFRLSIVALGLLLAFAAPTLAQEESAQDLFRQSAEAYRDGRFQEAADFLRRAHAIDPAPVLQYNLARALEGMGDFEGAIEAYEAFLEGDPDTEDRGSIEARLVTLRREVAEREALAEAAREEDVDSAGPPVTEPSRDAGGGPSPVPWILVGVGTAGLAVGVVLGVLAQDAHSAATEEPVHQRRVELVDEAQGYALGANVTFGVAGAIGLVGLIWGIVDVASSSSSDVEVAVGPGTVLVRGAF